MNVNEMKELHERIAKIGAKSRMKQIGAVKAVVLKIITESDEGKRPDVISEISRRMGVDPEMLRPRFSDDTEDGLVVVAQKRKPFGYEELDQCLQDACSAAGGEWRDPPGWAPPGCYYREGTSTLEKAAVSIAYGWGIAECEGRTFGKLMGRLWGLVT